MADVTVLFTDVRGGKITIPISPDSTMEMVAQVYAAQAKVDVDNLGLVCNGNRCVFAGFNTALAATEPDKDKRIKLVKEPWTATNEQCNTAEDFKVTTLVQILEPSMREERIKM